MTLYSLRLVLCIAFLHCTNFMFAQFIEPEIKFDLYFEDAIGNRDTVTVGFDSLADASINPIFGESNLRGIPFDSVFEVRGADKIGYVNQSNPVVYFYNHLFCTTIKVVQYPSIIIYAKHWPVTITWDSTYFEEDCYDWTHFTRNWNYLFHPEWVDGDIRLLGAQSRLTVHKQYMQQSVSYYNTRLEPIEGGGQDTVYNLWVGLCGHDPATVVGTNELDDNKVKLTVAPNPVVTHLDLKFEGQNFVATEVEKVIILDLLGIERELSSSTPWFERMQYDVSDLPHGAYHGKVFLRGQREPVTFQFVKL